MKRLALALIAAAGLLAAGAYLVAAERPLGAPTLFAHEGLTIVGDDSVYDSMQDLAQEADTVVIATPVGTSTYTPIDLGGAAPVFANFYRDLAVSRTLVGSATGVIRIATLGWNPESPVAIADLSPASELPAMMSEVPAGDAIFFLREFPPGSPFEGSYAVIGQKAGWVPLARAARTGRMRSGDAPLAELRNRDLTRLVVDIRRTMDAWRDRR